MNREDIIRMAEEAGFNISEYTSGKFAGKTSIFDYANVDIFYGLKHFAALVAAAEREALLLNDARYRFLRNGGWEVLQDTKYWTPENRFDGAIDAARLDVAIDAAIRARGNGGGK